MILAPPSTTLDLGDRKPEALSERYFATAMLGPLVLLVVGAAVVPFGIMLLLSFTNFSFNLPGHDGAFVGLANYAEALIDTRFHDSIRLQLLFAICTLPVEFSLGLLFAVLLWRSTRLSSVALIFIALPLVLAPITVGMIWRLLLHGDYGPIGYYLSSGLGGPVQSLLGAPDYAFWAIVVVDIWQWTPFFVVVLLAALRNVPATPLLAAAVDGASPGRIFWTITVPLLRPAIAITLLIRFMDSFKEFDKIYVLTRGGPASTTELTSVYTWIVSFDHGDLGYGSAITIVLYLLIYAVSVGLFAFLRPGWSR